MIFGDADTLRAYLDDAALTDERAEILLTHATETVRSIIGQSIDLVTDDRVIIEPGVGRRYAFLPELPVLAVSLVEQLASDGVTWVPLSVDAYRWTSDGAVSLLAQGQIVAYTSAGGRWESSLRVTYSHGYDVPPPDLVAVTTALAARLSGNPRNLTQETVGSMNQSYGVASSALTDVELRVLSRYELARV